MCEFLNGINLTALQINTVKLQWKRDTFKKCTLYKYLPYTDQFRSYSKKTVNQLYIYSTVLGAAIKCKQFSEITVESGTHLKSVKYTLTIFAVCLGGCKQLGIASHRDLEQMKPKVILLTPSEGTT